METIGNFFSSSFFEDSLTPLLQLLLAVYKESNNFYHLFQYLQLALRTQGIIQDLTLLTRVKQEEYLLNKYATWKKKQHTCSSSFFFFFPSSSESFQSYKKKNFFFFLRGTILLFFLTKKCYQLDYTFKFLCYKFNTEILKRLKEWGAE